MNNQEEAEKVCQLLAKNIDDFKHLVLNSMSAQERGQPFNRFLQADMNRISESAYQETESLEEWVAREFDSKSALKKAEKSVPGETLEQWVWRQPVKDNKPKTRLSFVAALEAWIQNEVKKDLMETRYASLEGSSSQQVRDLGLKLIVLADKLDKMKSDSTVR